MKVLSTYVSLQQGLAPLHVIINHASMTRKVEKSLCCWVQSWCKAISENFLRVDHPKSDIYTQMPHIAAFRGETVHTVDSVFVETKRPFNILHDKIIMLCKVKRYRIFL